MQQMDQRELMTLQHYMKEYGQQAEIFVGQLEMLENGRMEALAAIETLEAMLSADDGCCPPSDWWRGQRQGKGPRT